MEGAQLTGRRRFRSERKWGNERLILQVEINGWSYTNCGGYVDAERVKRWRDATTADLTTDDTPSSKGDQ